MKEPISKSDRDTLKATFASILRAQSGIDIAVLQTVIFWWEGSRLKLFYHLTRDGTEDELEELRCMTTEIMSDFEIAAVDEFFGTEQPAERENMVAWTVHPHSR